MADDDEIDDDELMPHTIAGQLATIGKATRSQLDETITLTIDDRPVTVRRVREVRNAHHEIVKEENGEPALRYTTVFDAASQAYATEPVDLTQASFELPESETQALIEMLEAENPIPILCHQPHMTPVAACRVCLVEIESRDGKEKSLAPACHRIVDDGVKIRTIKTSKKVQKSVSMILELLASDQPPPNDPKHNEFHLLYDKVKRICASSGTSVAPQPRFPNQKKDCPKDFSSPVVAVDHSACILCDRCIRACGEVRKNEIIGRAGKGYAARIAFDLGELIGKSNCVECRECAISCPTDAITLPRLEISPDYFHNHPDLRGSQPVTLEEVLSDPLFQGIPHKYVDWILPLIRRRRYSKGEVVCREGDYGHYAFRILGGEFAVTNGAGTTDGRLFQRRLSRRFWRNNSDTRQVRATDNGSQLVLLPGESLAKTLDADDLLFGEMACINKISRSATVVALGDDCEVRLLPANVVHVLRRDPEAREFVEHVHRSRAIDAHLRSVSLFEELRNDRDQFEECLRWLRDRVRLIQVSPGQEIFRQGFLADAFHLVRLGYVRISQKGLGGSEIEANYIGPGGSFGEMAVLATDPEIAAELNLAALPSGKTARRNATAIAMDHVEIIRIERQDLLKLYHEYPDVAHRLQDRIRKIQSTRDDFHLDNREIVPEIVELGMMNAQKLLVMDLESCTRCDECTKACADTHHGENRLVRDGLRIDKYLVATACRNCQDPYCMKSCPVDAIHRTVSLEIRIEDHCIGCGDCARNCPYGNITMQPVKQIRRHTDAATGREMAVVQYQAKTCDLCADTPAQDPSCVYACPHDAAHRMSGAELMQRVLADRERQAR